MQRQGRLKRSIVPKGFADTAAFALGRLLANDIPGLLLPPLLLPPPLLGPDIHLVGVGLGDVSQHIVASVQVHNALRRFAVHEILPPSQSGSLS